MRIIAGIAKGRKIYSGNVKGTRPTLDRVKESLFNIIGYPLRGFDILDLFAGTGNLGLEALSRGASSATFVDSNRECYKVIKKNVKLLNFNENSEILNKDSLDFLRDTTKRFDIIFMDPPYDELDIIFAAISLISSNNILKDSGFVVIEHDKNFKPEKQPDDIRKYGSTYLSFYKKASLIEFEESSQKK